MRFIDQNLPEGLVDKIELKTLLQLRREAGAVNLPGPKPIKDFRQKLGKKEDLDAILSELKRFPGKWKPLYEVSKLSFTNPKRELLPLFCALFASAVKGTPQERESLRRRLSVMKFDPTDAVMYQIRDYLLSAVENPDLYKWLGIPQQGFYPILKGNYTTEK